MEQLTGKTLNRYKLLNMLGKGGLGAVYQARDTVLQRDVAVKVLAPEYASQTNFQERFLQEARAAARVDHPSIVRVHDFGRTRIRSEAGEAISGEDNSFFYIVMEYIPGDNLRKMLNDLRAKRQWVILPEAVRIVQQIGEALEYAHKQDVLHLDIKPSNLMLRPSANSSDPKNNLPYRVVITDLGLAQLVGTETVSGENGSRGTPAYMSPEQALGQETDARSDVYSLGVLLFELAVGRVPFPARTIEEAARYHANEQIPNPRSIRPDLPQALQEVILRTLQKDPAQRYESCIQLVQALDQILPAVTEVAFRPDEDTHTISLMTQYENTVADEIFSPERKDILSQAGPRRSEVFVEILLSDRILRLVPMQSGDMTIGRDADNDIVLDNVKVSRRHARIQFDGDAYWVSDLNSKNGTFIDDRRLMPGEPAKWTADLGLRIGDFWLRMRQSPNADITATEYKVFPANEAETVAIENPLRSPSSKGSIGLFMETVQLSVIPGNSVTASLVLVNQGPDIDQLRISVSGIPANWIPNPPPVLRLQPGTQQDIDITIHPPLSPQTRPGRYPLTVRAFSQESPGHRAEVEAILTIGVFNQSTSELRPRQIWSNAAIHVSLQNGGNARQPFTITATDPADEIVFDPPQILISLEGGETTTVDFMASPRRPRILGGTRSSPFSVQITTPSGEIQTHNGELLANGLIPLWVLPVLLILCLCTSAVAVFGYFDLLQRPARARQTAQAGVEAVFLTQTAVLVAANQATQQALTATAVWNSQDADGDGLPNGEETRLGTNLNNPDSDGDTLPDGFEVYQFKCTDPLNPDSDGDGIPDNQDPDPCSAATVTPTRTPVTPTPATPTPTATTLVIVVTATSPSTSLPPTPTLTETSPPGITPTPLGASRLVIFSTNRDGNYEIYAMLNDGTRQTRATNNSADDREPALSNSGLRTVFVSNRDGNDEIYVMNVDGSDQTRLTNNDANDTSPAWSADGNRIAFVSDRDGNKEIYIMNADGSGLTRLTGNEVDDDHPSWSPDGARLVFDRAVESGRHIYGIDTGGGEAVALVENGAINQDPAYSPDGARIVYVSNTTGIMEIYIMNANGSGQSQLTNLALNAYSPVWSNDGSYLIFQSRLTGDGEIYRIAVSDINAINLTNNTFDDADPTW